MSESGRINKLEPVEISMSEYPLPSRSAIAVPVDAELKLVAVALKDTVLEPPTVLLTCS